MSTKPPILIGGSPPQLSDVIKADQPLARDTPPAGPLPSAPTQAELSHILKDDGMGKLERILRAKQNHLSDRARSSDATASDSEAEALPSHGLGRDFRFGTSSLVHPVTGEPISFSRLTKSEMQKIGFDVRAELFCLARGYLQRCQEGAPPAVVAKRIDRTDPVGHKARSDGSVVELFRRLDALAEAHARYHFDGPDWKTEFRNQVKPALKLLEEISEKLPSLTVDSVGFQELLAACEAYELPYVLHPITGAKIPIAQLTEADVEAVTVAVRHAILKMGLDFIERCERGESGAVVGAEFQNALRLGGAVSMMTQRLRVFGNRCHEAQFGYSTFGDGIVHDLGLLSVAMMSVALELEKNPSPDFSKLRALCRTDAPSRVKDVLARVRNLLDSWHSGYVRQTRHVRDWPAFRFSVTLPEDTPFDVGREREMPAGWEKLEIHVRELGKNAIKYGETYGRIYWEVPDTIVAENDGPGFPDGFEIKPGVRFDPERAEGTGFGLSELLKDAERYGWKVTIESRPGFTRVAIQLHP